MNFGQALELLKSNDRVMRNGWNGKGMWLIIIHEDEYKLESYKHFNSQRLAPYIAMRTADGALVPWLASQTDILAEDWELVN